MTTNHYKVDPRHAKELWAGLPHIEPPLITVSDEPLDVVKRLLKASELADSLNRHTQTFVPIKEIHNDR